MLSRSAKRDADAKVHVVGTRLVAHEGPAARRIELGELTERPRRHREHFSEEGCDFVIEGFDSFLRVHEHFYHAIFSRSLPRLRAS